MFKTITTLITPMEILVSSQHFEFFPDHRAKDRLKVKIFMGAFLIFLFYSEESNKATCPRLSANNFTLCELLIHIRA